MRVPECYRFGQVEIRVAERRVIVQGQPANVGARAFDLLVTLIAHRERVVSKDELLALVWPGLIVEENNLQVQVSSLRKLLGVNALATIPGRGYRFTLTPDTEGGEAAAAAPNTSKPRHNLPAQLNSFVGRKREIDELKELLATTRLVTLTSMGGTGKTRLSLQVAGDVLDDYTDGVWLVELAALADARLVPEAVASVLGVKEEAGRPVIAALEKFVKDRQLLLILDNCEHLVAAAAGLAKTLLRAGRAMHVLASSRERLQVTGETAYPVPSLAIPDTPDIAAKGTATELEDFKQNEAVRLFVDRATAAQPRFQVTEKNVAAIAEICRRLDGIPLAIELAAARMYAMSAEQIAARLGDRFNLLTGGDKTAMPRQQTLRASIDWSVDLLSEAERSLLRRLSVFAGGWTLSAAEAVGAQVNAKTALDAEISTPSVLDTLIQLVEKSLLIVDAHGERYRMLETVRQYAHEQLVASGEEHAVRTCHLNFYLALAEQARPALAGTEQGAWLARLDWERENFLAAHMHAGRISDDETPNLQLVRALKPYWITRGHLALGLQMTLEALQHPKAMTRCLARCKGLFDVGQIEVVMGHYADAFQHLEESLAIARETGDERRVAMTLQPLGMACLGNGDLVAARLHLEEALSRANTLCNKFEIAAAASALAQLLRLAGDTKSATTLYEQSLAIARELNNSENIAVCLLNLAMVLIDQQIAARPTIMLIEVLDIAEQIGSKRIGQSALEVTSGHAASLKQWETAAAFYGMAESLAAETGLQRDPADEAFLESHLINVRNSLDSLQFSVATNTGSALCFEEKLRLARVWLKKEVDLAECQPNRSLSISHH